MLLKTFFDPALAQNAYLIASDQSKEAIVIDPLRDLTPYLDYATEQGLQIVAAVETHIHADFVSGGHEIAAALGAILYLSGHGDQHGYRFQHDPLDVRYVREGDVIAVGGMSLTILYTPGHTPEHISLIVTAEGTDQPFAIFTGDALFVGDVGRPDLMEVAGLSVSKEDSARAQYQTVQRFQALPEYLQILPGHGAGSACGKALGNLPTSTIGYEKRFNPAFQFTDEALFSAWLLQDQPEVPSYFAQMKKVNQVGAVLLSSLTFPRPVIYDSEIKIAAQKLLIDTRPREVFALAHLPGSVNIVSSHAKFSTWVGWFVNYEEPIYLVVDETELAEVVMRLRVIGIDQIGGYVRPETAMRYHYSTPQIGIEVARAKQSAGATIVDVRSQSEREEGYIPESLYIPMGEIPTRFREIPAQKEVIVQCGSGVRSQIVASWLQKHGLKQVFNLDGGIDAWKKADFPITVD
ncbi:MAG: rhodanese-like domain-containing protein [Anaerolineae bacterium]|jgi:hydroxyacylglutathione hydrolase|nr:rhodanese-like domain-containing protein [Anaerolineae bacterium]